MKPTNPYWLGSNIKSYLGIIFGLSGFFWLYLLVKFSLDIAVEIGGK